MGFSTDFLWGAASAAHQIEGSYDGDGKGAGIWDALHEGHIKHDENGDIACDHYKRYKEDIGIMKELGLKAYRFSVSWPRIIPKEGKINEKGLQFYINLVKELKGAGIEPICTLFHWNLPMWVHEKGGWKCSNVSDYFADYVEIVVNALSNNVKYWITLNEPQCFIGQGYISGMHAPFLTEINHEELLARNVMVAHGKAVLKIRRNTKQSVFIGMALTGNCMTPFTSNEDEIEKSRKMTYSKRAGIKGIDYWADPMIIGLVPEMLKDVLTKEDMQIIHQPLDFFGFNVYNSGVYTELKGVKNSNLYPGLPRTGMDWPITPEVLYWAPKYHYERYHLPILITENGMANNDFVMLDGNVHDPQRIDFIHTYLQNLKKVVEDGVPVIGYLHWSIMDNFEWTEGYDKRFGLIYIDYRTQQRTIKDSGYFYADVIRRNGENL